VLTWRDETATLVVIFVAIVVPRANEEVFEETMNNFFLFLNLNLGFWDYGNF